MVPEELLTVNAEEIDLELTSDGDGFEEIMVETEELEVVELGEIGAELEGEELGTVLEPGELGAELKGEELGADELGPDEDEGGEGGWMKEGYGGK